MTRSRGLSSSSFYSPTRASANPCLYIGTMRLQALSAALSTTLTVVRTLSCHSAAAASSIRGVGIIAKTPFNTQ